MTNGKKNNSLRRKREGGLVKENKEARYENWGLKHEVEKERLREQEGKVPHHHPKQKNERGMSNLYKP